MICQRSNPVSQFSTWNRSQFLNPDNPRPPIVFNGGRKTRKRCITTRITQRGHDARRVDSDQVGLKVHDKLAALDAM